MFFYMARYLYFIKTSDRSLLQYLTSDDIDYFAVNKLSVKDILFSPSDKQYQSKTMRYILSIILEKHFGKPMRNKKKAWIKDITIQVSLYQKWPVLLQIQRCALFKADIVLLPTFPLNKANIEDTLIFCTNFLHSYS